MTPVYRARETAHGLVVASRLRPAHSHWTRLRGLIGTASLPEGHGLWIRPCRQVHMFWMRYAIDVVFLDGEQRIVAVVENLPPRAISPKVSIATSVLELPVGTIARAGLTPGTRIDIAATTAA
jgi:uncharacterized membrane protein (UPF0127 family)